MESDIVSVESINMRVRRRTVSARTSGEEGEEGESDSLVVQHGSVGSARFLGVSCRSVGRSVCARRCRCRCVAGHACVRVDDAGPKSAEGLVMRDGGPPRAPTGSTFRSIRLNVKTRNISRLILSVFDPLSLFVFTDNASSSSFLKRRMRGEGATSQGPRSLETLGGWQVDLSRESKNSSLFF